MYYSPASAYVIESQTKMVVRFGRRNYLVHGGSIRHLTDDFDLSVNMAMEIAAPATVAVPTPDFGVPDRRLMLSALNRTVQALFDGKKVYVGCAYGYGRTGTFLGGLFKLSKEVNRLVLGEVDGRDPVEYVRNYYKKAAIESMSQERFVRSLDLGWLPKRIALRMKPQIIFDKRYWLPAE